MTTSEQLAMPTVKLPDPHQVAESLSRIKETTKSIVTNYLEQQGKPKGTASTLSRDSSMLIGKSFLELWQRLLLNPSKLAEAQLEFWKDYATLWGRTTRRMFGADVEPVIQPEKGDRRWKDPQWAESVAFDFIKQSYLLAARTIQEAVEGATGLGPDAAKRVEFFTQQFLDTMSPSNTIALNPTVLKATMESGGANLLAGFANVLEDIERSGSQLQVSRQKEGAFQLGKDVATTPGKVVFKNDLMELIQYTPTTGTVHKRPLLVIPPWINKYYILDLSPKNSFVRWAVSEGLTVFIISWTNPDQRLASKGFDDYLSEGPLAALDVIEKITGEHEVGAVGYCLGGTLLSCTLAYLAEIGDPRITAATLFTTLTDFSEPGEIGVFIDPEQLDILERDMNKVGYLEGTQMGGAWAMLRANDLLWATVVQKYLLGKDPLPFDIVFWAADTTRMPAKMHNYYLRNMYQHNRLRQPGGLTLLGKPIDLGKIKVPTYFFSAREDHVAPWKSTYAGTQLFGGPVRFVLGGSGHNAGVLNPPGSTAYGYATNPEVPADPAAWDAKAERHPGSWWPDWLGWVKPSSGEQIAAKTRQPGEGPVRALEDAPGSYVAIRY